mgnify:CR=1 FL=1
MDFLIKGMPIKGIIFDLDGVIIKQKLDFAAIKQEIFGDTEGFILERMASLSGPEGERAERILDRHERVASEQAELNDGVKELFEYLEREGVYRALVTRNSRETVEIVQKKFSLNLDAIITREDAPAKPSPEPVLLACCRMGLSIEECIFVGDSELDMLAGRKAGVKTVLLKNQNNPYSENANFVIDSLWDIFNLLNLKGVDNDPRP